MTDTRIVLTVIVLLGLFALAGLGGTVWLISVNTDASSVATVSGLTGTALGAVATMLASTRSTSGDAGTVTASVDVTAPADS